MEKSNQKLDQEYIPVLRSRKHDCDWHCIIKLGTVSVV